MDIFPQWVIQQIHHFRFFWIYPSCYRFQLMCLEIQRMFDFEQRDSCEYIIQYFQVPKKQLWSSKPAMCTLHFRELFIHRNALNMSKVIGISNAVTVTRALKLFVDSYSSKLVSFQFEKNFNFLFLGPVFSMSNSITFELLFRQSTKWGLVLIGNKSITDCHFMMQKIRGNSLVKGFNYGCFTCHRPVRKLGSSYISTHLLWNLDNVPTSKNWTKNLIIIKCYTDCEVKILERHCVQIQTIMKQRN